MIAILCSEKLRNNAIKKAISDQLDLASNIIASDFSKKIHDFDEVKYIDYTILETLIENNVTDLNKFNYLDYFVNLLAKVFDNKDFGSYKSASLSIIVPEIQAHSNDVTRSKIINNLRIRFAKEKYIEKANGDNIFYFADQFLYKGNLVELISILQEDLLKLKEN